MGPESHSMTEMDVLPVLYCSDIFQLFLLRPDFINIGSRNLAASMRNFWERHKKDFIKISTREVGKCEHSRQRN